MVLIQVENARKLGKKLKKDWDFRGLGTKKQIKDFFNDYPIQDLPTLDKRYLDCSYFLMYGKIIDLDELYEQFKEWTREYHF